MNAIEIINEWNAKTATQQQDFCRNCVFKAIKQGRKLKPGHDVEDAMQNTFVAVLERLADLDSMEAACKRMENRGRTETLVLVSTGHLHGQAHPRTPTVQSSWMCRSQRHCKQAPALERE